MDKRSKYSNTAFINGAQIKKKKLFGFTAWVQEWYNYKLNHVEGPLATTASGLSTVSIK